MSGAWLRFSSASTSPSVMSRAVRSPSVGTTAICVVSEANWSVKPVWIPLPSATSTITAATPMTIPSVVSTERSRLARSPRRAIRNASYRFTSWPPPAAAAGSRR